MRHFLLFLLLFPLFANAQAPFDEGRVLFLGDSITAGGGYISFTEYFLNQQFPDSSFDIISIGLGSETASGRSETDHPFPRPCIHSRLEGALAKVKPNVVFACYGMNDGIYRPQSEAGLQAYIDGMEKLRKRALAADVKTVVFMTPPPFDPMSSRRLGKPDAKDWSYKAPHPDYDAVLADYARWINTSAHKPSVDFHTALTKAATKRRVGQPDFSFSGDGIHPNAEGHLLMAKTLLRDLDIPFEDADLKTIQADPLYKAVAKRRQTRTKDWLKHVGYTRGRTVGPTPLGDVEARCANMQDEIDSLRRAPQPSAK